MLVSESITKIRRLINDVEEEIFDDDQILTIFGRVQQDFCREVAVELGVVLLKAPPHIDYTITHGFEEGYCSDGVFLAGFEGASQNATQPWELEASYTQTSDGGNTVTGGADIPHVDDLQQPLPFYMPSDVYTITSLLWDSKAVEQRSKERVDEEYNDGYYGIGDVVDYFDTHISSRSRAFYTRGIPSVYQTSGTNQASQIDEELLSDVFYVFCQLVPGRPTAVSDTIEVYEPFVKYIEYGVASRLYAADTEKRSELWASHYESRYVMGGRLCLAAIGKGYEMRVRRQGRMTSYGLKPGRPRLPAHYPSVEF